MDSTARIVQLASLIASQTPSTQDYLRAHDLPAPSFALEALDSPAIPDDAANIQAARASVISACTELKDLLTGPRALLKFQWTDHASVKAILRFKLDQSFEVGGGTDFKRMSDFSGLNERNVRRIVRHAILNHRFFCEDAPGVITHSALTAILARDPAARNALVVELDEFWRAGVHMADAMGKWPNSEVCNETGFSVANNTSKSMFDLFADNPDRGIRFAQYFSKPEPVATADEIVDNYPWAGKRKMVDVGGSHGTVAIGIARRFPEMRCVVQDLPGPIAEGELRLAEELRDKVTFMAHDFFTPQPIEADVYFFRSIFHNWSDKYCIEILRNLIPALRTGARVVIHERVLPGFGDIATEDAVRAINLDVGMQQLLNAHQRELHEWPELSRAADPRYRYVGARHPEGALRWIIEAEWRDDATV